MPQPDEQPLAEALARYLDARTTAGEGELPCPPGLDTEIETLIAIDEALAHATNFPEGAPGGMGVQASPVETGATGGASRLLRPSDDASGFSTAASDRFLTIPDRLSGHKILSEIGSGGMGVVLLAADERLGRKVAIKMLSPRYADHPGLKARFMREARAMARISHPNIARIYSLGPEDERPHFVMEYLEGSPLNRVAGKLTFAQKAELMRTVALAVEFLHQHGVVHRDLKPANILLTPDFEPKILDFGLALESGPDQNRLSLAGEIVGTPEYLSPEQTHGGEAIDARTDIFSLGAVLYELLCGSPPFTASTVTEVVRRIREDDPELPTRRNAAVPRELQNVCLKALEKDPAQRYASARDMAEDLERFLAGETVHAEPEAYSRIIAQQIERHLADVEGWHRDKIISDAEYDGLRRRYDRLAEREDAWIMETRRLTLPQVSLYLGVWILSAGAALLTIFKYPKLTGTAAVMVAYAAVIAPAWIGIRFWKRGRLRVAVAFLLGVCLLAPLAFVVGTEEYGLFAGFTQGRRDLELFEKLGFAKTLTNAQIWWALLTAMPVSLWLRRFTRASVFTLAFAFTAALFALAGLLRMGAIEWLDKDPGRFYLNLLPYAVLFMAAGFIVERLRMNDDSRYLYPFAILFTWAALTGVATFHKPYADWLLRAAPWTRGQVEYLFIFNAGIYFALDRLCDLLSTPQVRMAGRTFRFVIPGHVLTSLFLLGISATDAGLIGEARWLEWLLVIAACAFVFASIPRQMKNFFASGLVFLAIGIVRLQRDYFKDQAVWPILLLVAGLALMLAAAYYAPLRIRLERLFNKKVRA